MMCELVKATDQDLAHRVWPTFIDTPPTLPTMPPAVRALFNLEKTKAAVQRREPVSEVCE